jgi:hypothetical protein
MTDQKNQSLLEQLQKDEDIFISYLRSRFPFFHNSNFFLRDLEYGIKSFFEKKNIKLSSSDTEQLGKYMSKHYEQKGYFKNIGENVWTIKLPQYITTKPGDPF